MSKGGKKHIGAGTHGKGAGSGARSDVPNDKIGENNRDKSQHSESRGMDGKHIQTEQYRNHATNRLVDDEDE
jgi:hypothetical protein